MGSGRSLSTDNTDAPYSICPKGWRLPTSRTTDTSSWQTTSDFYVMAHQYGLTSTTSTSQSTSAFNSQAGPGTTPNFLLAGGYRSNYFDYDTSYGLYWSSTSEYSTNARLLYFYSSRVDSSYNNYRYAGFSVRCLKRDEYTIHYDANGGSGEMGDQVVYVGTTNTLNINAFTAPNNNLVFIGWNTVPNGSGTSYSNRASVTDLAAANSTITLYAQWVEGVYMENVTKATCPANATTVYDSRDGAPYLVQKLKDGNCWMLENLRLDISDSEIRSRMTTSNTNTTSAGLTMLGSTINGADSSTWSDSYTTPYINNTNKDVKVTSYGTAAVNGKAKVGIYYNFCAASGGTICVSSNPNITSYDICPAGWHLPAGDSNADSFHYLYYNNTYGYGSNDTDFRNALSTPLSGTFGGGIPRNQNTYGYFWSSHTYPLFVSSSTIFPQDIPDPKTGYSIRCVRTSD